MKKSIKAHSQGICRRGRASPPPPPPPLQNPQVRRFGLATATAGAPRTRLLRRAEAVRTCCFCLGTPPCLIERVCGVSWGRTTHEELCFVWGGGGGGGGGARQDGQLSASAASPVWEGRNIFWAASFYPRIKSLRRTHLCRQKEQRSSRSLVAEDSKTASFDANRIK